MNVKLISKWMNHVFTMLNSRELSRIDEHQEEKMLHIRKRGADNRSTYTSAIEHAWTSASSSGRILYCATEYSTVMSWVRQKRMRTLGNYPYVSHWFLSSLTEYFLKEFSVLFATILYSHRSPVDQSEQAQALMHWTCQVSRFRNIWRELSFRVRQSALDPQEYKQRFQLLDHLCESGESGSSHAASADQKNGILKKQMSKSSVWFSISRKTGARAW